MIFDERKNKISLAQDPNIRSAPNSGGVNNILVRYNPDSQIILPISRLQLQIFWINTVQFPTSTVWAVHCRVRQVALQDRLSCFRNLIS